MWRAPYAMRNLRGARLMQDTTYAAQDKLTRRKINAGHNLRGAEEIREKLAEFCHDINSCNKGRN